MTHRWQIRRYREDDISALTALINAADAAVGLPMRASDEGLRSQFNSPGLDPPQQVIVAEAMPGDEQQVGQLLGYGRAFPGGDHAGVERVYDVSSECISPEAIAAWPTHWQSKLWR